jgi:sterol desaturase/sphingolipid hydroxylase (fatty acid hydroxylase superfamily)
MKNLFRYTPPTVLNNVTYGAGLALALPLIARYGQSVLNWATSRWSDFTILVGFGFALYLLVFWTWGLFYILLDRYQKPAFLVRYRIQTPAPGAPDKSSSPTLREALPVVFMNQFAGTLPGLVVLFYVMHWRGVRPTDPIPTTATILLKLVAIILIEEVLFFTAHFAMHTRPLFRTLHHLHHRYRRPIGISTHYVHYLEHLVGNITPIFAAIVLTRADVITSFLWVVIAVTNAIHTHSNYAIPWMSWSVDHDFHHWQARGNYGVLGLCDRIFGTDREFRQLAKRTAAERSAPAATPSEA